MNKNVTAVLVLVLAAGCGSLREEASAPVAARSDVVEQDCTRPVDPYLHLMCADPEEAARRARLAEEARLARERKEAEERAERERLERERAERLAREEAARKQREAEEAERRRREAEEAERRRLEAERKAREEQERREREAAEALARQRAEEAARECRRLAQVRSEGRAMLESFVAKYGETEEFKGIAAQITAFLNETREEKPCPPPPG